MPSQEKRLANTLRVAVARHCAKFGEQWTVKAHGNVINVTMSESEPTQASVVTTTVKAEPNAEPTREQFVQFLNQLECGQPVTLPMSYANRFEQFATWIDEHCSQVLLDIEYTDTQQGLTIIRKA